MPTHPRLLPRDHSGGRPLFITWHVRAGLPPIRKPATGALSAADAFAWMDSYLSRASSERFGREDVARMVVDSLHYAAGTLRHCDLYAYVAMPAHVHALLLPHVSAGKLLQSMKWFSAREVSRVFGCAGETFWQHETSRHWVRDESEFDRIRAYIEDAPVRAGLAGRPEDYRWSSAHLRAYYRPYVSPRDVSAA